VCSLAKECVLYGIQGGGGRVGPKPRWRQRQRLRRRQRHRDRDRDRDREGREEDLIELRVIVKIEGGVVHELAGEDVEDGREVGCLPAGYALGPLERVDVARHELHPRL